MTSWIVAVLGTNVWFNCREHRQYTIYCSDIATIQRKRHAIDLTKPVAIEQSISWCDNSVADIPKTDFSVYLETAKYDASAPWPCLF